MDGFIRGRVFQRVCFEVAACTKAACRAFPEDRALSIGPVKNPKATIWLETLAFSILTALALFLSAGTIDYWQAWVFLGVNTVSSVPLILFISNDPILLENRTKAGPAAEKRAIQKIIVLCAGLPAIAAFVVPGLDRRFGWSSVPSWLSVLGDLLVIVAMWMVFRVFRENSFGSATVEVAKNQRVVSTGPYAIVRNPMYASAVVYFIGMSLALGSYWALIPAVLTILGLVWRLFDEEKFLAKNLPGYAEYCARVRWHLIPGLF
jgi:protein-S-isoprenylcysteine O-methyltransferase Ste14